MNGRAYFRHADRQAIAVATLGVHVQHYEATAGWVRTTRIHAERAVSSGLAKCCEQDGQDIGRLHWMEEVRPDQYRKGKR